MKGSDPQETSSTKSKQTQMKHKWSRAVKSKPNKKDQSSKGISVKAMVKRPLQKTDDVGDKSPSILNEKSYENIRILSDHEISDLYCHYGSIDDSIRKDSNSQISLGPNNNKTIDMDMPDKLKNIIENYNENNSSNNSSFYSSGKNFLEEGKKILDQKNLINLTSKDSKGSNQQQHLESNNSYPYSIQSSIDSSCNKYTGSKHNPNNAKMNISNFRQTELSFGFSSSKISLQSLTDSQHKNKPDPSNINRTSNHSSKNKPNESIVIGSRQAINNTLCSSQRNSNNSDSMVNPEKMSLKLTDNDFFHQESFVNLQNNDSDFFQTQTDHFNKSAEGSEDSRAFPNRKYHLTPSSFANKSKSISKGETFFSEENSLVQLPDSCEDLNHLYLRQQSYDYSNSNLMSPIDIKKEANLSLDRDAFKGFDEVNIQENEEYERSDDFNNMLKTNLGYCYNEIEDYNMWREQMKNIAEDEDHLCRILIDNKLRIIDPFYNHNMNLIISEENSLADEESVLVLDKNQSNGQLLGKVNNSMLKSDCKWMKSTHLITRKGKQGALNQPSN
jgi:hypothetical protein